MTSRNKILDRVKAARPPLVPLREDLPVKTTVWDVKDFAAILTSLHASVINIGQRSDLSHYVAELKSTGAGVFDGLQGEQSNRSEELFYSIVEGSLGVCENGAIWVDTATLAAGSMDILFSCQHLVILLAKERIVGDMHEAYARLPLRGFGYGVFISGPSKTADIEQSLVIGAHGPKALTVLLY